MLVKGTIDLIQPEPPSPNPFIVVHSFNYFFSLCSGAMYNSLYVFTLSPFLLEATQGYLNNSLAMLPPVSNTPASSPHRWHKRRRRKAQWTERTRVLSLPHLVQALQPPPPLPSHPLDPQS